MINEIHDILMVSGDDTELLAFDIVIDRLSYDTADEYDTSDDEMETVLLDDHPSFTEESEDEETTDQEYDDLMRFAGGNYIMRINDRGQLEFPSRQSQDNDPYTAPEEFITIDGSDTDYANVFAIDLRDTLPRLKHKLLKLEYQCLILSCAFHNYGVVKSSIIADKVKNLTFHYATKSGISLSVEDLRIPPEKRNLLGTTINDQLRSSANLIADFWYTSWVDAGKPDLSRINTGWSAGTQLKLAAELKTFHENKLLENKLLLSKKAEVKAGE